MRLTPIALALSLCLLPGALRAQFRPGGEQAAGWAPASVGVRIGWDNVQQGEIVGALLRLPVLPSGSVELVPNADITFLRGLKEYQVNFEAVYLTAGRMGGVYVGGGIGFRNSRFSPDPSVGRRNARTLSVVAGVRFGGLGRLRPELEARWIFQDEYTRDPRPVALGVSVALW
jgi:hypothetical protein